jgi:hypothetical protein
VQNTELEFLIPLFASYATVAGVLLLMEHYLMNACYIPGIVSVLRDTLSHKSNQILDNILSLSLLIYKKKMENNRIL